MYRSFVFFRCLPEHCFLQRGKQQGDQLRALDNNYIINSVVCYRVKEEFAVILK